MKRIFFLALGKVVFRGKSNLGGGDSCINLEEVEGSQDKQSTETEEL
jgi:hypothetical protein